MPAEQVEATLALQLADRKIISLDEPLATWFPTYPGATLATVRMAGFSDTGFGDYVYGTADSSLGIPAFADVLYRNVYQSFTPDELIARSLPPYQTPAFAPPGVRGHIRTPTL